MDEFDAWMEIAKWPSELQFEYLERVAIKMDSGIREQEAERSAYEEIRKRVLAK